MAAELSETNLIVLNHRYARFICFINIEYIEDVFAQKESRIIASYKFYVFKNKIGMK